MPTAGNVAGYLRVSTLILTEFDNCIRYINLLENNLFN